MHRQIVEAGWHSWRYVANAPQCRAMWLERAMRTEPTHPPRCWAQVGRGSSNTLARIGSMGGDGRFEGAAAEKAVPFPRCPSILSFAALNPFYGDRSRIRRGGDWRDPPQAWVREMG